MAVRRMHRDVLYSAKSQEGDAVTSMDWTVCRKEPGMAVRRMHKDAGRYGYTEGIGRVESGTETESNAGAVTEMAVRQVHTHSPNVNSINSGLYFPITCLNNTCSNKLFK